MPSWMVILKKKVYMVLSPKVFHNPRKVYKFKKVLYSLKQSPCVWFAKFFNALTSFNFHLSHHNFALFLKCTFANSFFLSLYVDDMIITSDDIDMIATLKSNLVSRFEMKDLGVLWYFLGIEVTSSLKSYFLS